MSHLYLKVVTVPCQRAGILEELRASIATPGNISKPESIKEWLKKNGDAKAQELLLKTAYDGALGEIIAISWAFDDEPVRCLSRSLDMSEGVLIEDFYSQLAAGVLANEARYQAQVVGHNVLGFDLRFLFQRSVILSLQPPFNLGHDNRYNNSRVYDVMVAWAGFNKFMSLQDLGRAIGIAAPASLGPAEFLALAKANELATISDLCAADALLIRQIFHAMTFSEFFQEVGHAEAA